MNTLVAAVARACRERPFAGKLLLAPTRRVGQQWLDAMARGGVPALNCRVETIRSLALELAAPAMAAAGVALASRRAALLVLEQVAGSLRPRLSYLREAAGRPGFAAILQRTIEALRLEGVPEGRLRRGVLVDDRKAADVKALLSAWRAALASASLADYGDLLELAIARLAAEPDALGREALVLVPADLERRGLERRLLEALPAVRVAELPVDPPGQGAAVRFRRAVGEVNEVRAALREILERGAALDEVEVLHTDAATFLPLLRETFAALLRAGAEPWEEPPVTFAEGVPCDASRPGRALAGWLAWVEGGHPQEGLVGMVRDGLLAPGEESGAGGARVGFSRLAALLRGLGVGKGLERYLPRIDRRARVLEARLVEPAAGEGEATEEEAPEARRERIERDLRALRALRGLVARLVPLSGPGMTGAGLVEAARGMLEGCARRADRFDEYAHEKLREELLETGRLLAAGRAPAFDARGWLRDLPAETKVLGSGPRPGCLHVDRLGGGGHSGRAHTVVLGLDDGRFPGAGLQDPLLLDAERARLAPGMDTAAARLEAAADGFRRLLGRLRGEVTLSWPCRDVVEDRDLFPSPLVLESYRAAAGDPAADLARLLGAVPAVSFAPERGTAALDLPEWWLWRFTAGEGPPGAAAFVAARAPHLARGAQGARFRLGTEFTAWDGRVPEAGPRLDPGDERGRVVSPNGLEAAGACPLRFFFRYGLEIAPPEEVRVEPGRWLDPLARGSLLHELFEDFVRELAEGGRAPEAGRDRARLLELLDAKIAAARETQPPPSEATFARERRELARTAETFLRADAEHCRAAASVPAWLEASLGMPPGPHATAIDTPDAVPVGLPGGAIRTRGRVDRIDRAGGAYAIWDYKTGSPRSYEGADPFREGRHLQPYLYIRMVERRLREAVDRGATVASFGYFFPGFRFAGRRIAWPAGELDAGGGIVERLRRLIASGAFPATTDARDCAFCDYAAVCGDVTAVAAASAGKLRSGEPLLAPFRELRAASLGEGGEGE